MKNAVAPAKWTRENIASMKEQCIAMGWAIDWSREFATCDPDYYKWNQWLFLKMLEKGIAYLEDRRRQLGSRRPDGARQRAGGRRQGLALGRAGREARDPDVLPADHRLRGGAPRVPRQDARMARAREDDAGQLDRQERGRALRASRTTSADDAGKLVGDGRMYVFTTRADTIMGVTFCAVAPEHPLAPSPPRSRPEARRVRRRMPARHR